MDQQRHTRNLRFLWALLIIALIYLGLLAGLHTLTGHRLWDGSIGVVLGLFICSRPAGHAIDLLFAQRGEFQRLTAELSGVGWLALNLLVLFAGWVVIVTGATRFAGGG
jgi:hypothetical protein